MATSNFSNVRVDALYFDTVDTLAPKWKQFATDLSISPEQINMLEKATFVSNSTKFHWVLSTWESSGCNLEQFHSATKNQSKSLGKQLTPKAFKAKYMTEAKPTKQSSYLEDLTVIPTLQEYDELSQWQTEKQSQEVLQEELSTLQSHVKTLNQEQQRSQQLKQQLETQLAKSQATVQRLEAELKKSVDTASTLKAELTEKEQKLQSAYEVNLRLEKENKEKVAQLAERDQKVTDLSVQNQQLRQQVAESECPTKSTQQESSSDEFDFVALNYASLIDELRKVLPEQAEQIIQAAANAVEEKEKAKAQNVELTLESQASPSAPLPPEKMPTTLAPQPPTAPGYEATNYSGPRFDGSLARVAVNSLTEFEVQEIGYEFSAHWHAVGTYFGLEDNFLKITKMKNGNQPQPEDQCMYDVLLQIRKDGYRSKMTIEQLTKKMTVCLERARVSGNIIESMQKYYHELAVKYAR
ncbi:hypothetical protein [Parashewanella tropica]|uniref:hypothetical protein n=1 Tax=Parashewanella tropica TaxID=2547970 RepID=UPI001059693F|nr:hypothetical protein [Parashewanella tropica]